MTVLIRRGTVSDAQNAIETLQKSITFLCVADHKYNSDDISEWLSNKTTRNWVRWVGRDDAIVLIAEKGSKLLGVGMADLHGEILLNYVHPDARFCGVSKLIITALECNLLENGIKKSFLVPTITAKDFYIRQGYSFENNSPYLSKKNNNDRFSFNGSLKTFAK